MSDDLDGKMAVFTAKGRETKLKIKSRTLTIGTKESCDLVIRDPIAAEEHCRVIFDGSTFRIADIGSVTGTFVNAVQVTGSVRLASGDEIVLGVSRLAVAVGEEEGLASLTLNVRPRGFRFTEIGRKSPAEDKFRHDRDLWAFTEVRLGRFPPLRAGNLAAAVLGAAFLGLLLAGSFQERILEPGSLCRAHAQLFAPGVDLAIPASEVDLARREGCNACHEAFGGAPTSRCGSCHADMMAKQHPFQTSAGAALDPAKVSRPWDDDDCARCHQEHLGLDARAGGFIPAASSVADACGTCHAGTALAAKGFPAGGKPAQVQREERTFSAFAFGHDDHVTLKSRETGALLACRVCHQLDPGAVADAASRIDERDKKRKDYLPVPFETCARCHVLKPGADPDDGRDRSLAGWWPQARDEKGVPANLWTVNWHGTDAADATCKECHAELFRADFRTVRRLDVKADAYAGVKARYALERRSHSLEFEKHAAGKACVDCHRRETPLSALQPTTALFWHAAHMRALSGNDAGERRLVSQACLECHEDRRASAGLTDHASSGLYGWAPASCAEGCHRELTPKDAAGRPLSPSPRPALPAQASGNPAPIQVVRTDFPHSKHLVFREDGPLKDGCFSCHEFLRPAGASAFASVPITRPEAGDCRTCHAKHSNVGGGFCERCHPMEAPRYNDYLGRRPPPDRPFPARPWPEPNAFNHSSSGHKDVDCAECHRLEGAGGIASARALEDVPIPDEADLVCRDCHLSRKQRFHWR